MKVSTLNEWTRPDCYFGATWEGYYVFLGQNRDSDSLERSNFISGLKAIGGESETGEGVQVVRESHWACGWIEWIAIPAGPSVALAKALEVMERLEGYSVVNEDHWSEMEHEEAHEVWSRCYHDCDRVEYIRDNPDQFYFRSWADLRSCVRGEWFGGSASELLS
jgi:hypothetical protein